MAYCNHCGSELPEGARYCSRCGASVQPSSPYGTYRSAPNAPSPIEESGSGGWGVLGFFFPVVGLILFLIWRTEKPKSSRAAGIGALISVILSVVMGVLFAVLSFFLLALGSSAYAANLLALPFV